MCVTHTYTAMKKCEKGFTGLMAHLLLSQVFKWAHCPAHYSRTSQPHCAVWFLLLRRRPLNKGLQQGGGGGWIVKTGAVNIEDWIGYKKNLKKKFWIKKFGDKVSDKRLDEKIWPKKTGSKIFLQFFWSKLFHQIFLQPLKFSTFSAPVFTWEIALEMFNGGSHVSHLTLSFSAAIFQNVNQMNEWMNECMNRWMGSKEWLASPVIIPSCILWANSEVSVCDMDHAINPGAIGYAAHQTGFDRS